MIVTSGRDETSPLILVTVALPMIGDGFPTRHLQRCPS